MWILVSYIYIEHYIACSILLWRAPWCKGEGAGTQIWMPQQFFNCTLKMTIFHDVRMRLGFHIISRVFLIRTLRGHVYVCIWSRCAHKQQRHTESYRYVFIYTYKYNINIYNTYIYMYIHIPTRICLHILLGNRVWIFRVSFRYSLFKFRLVETVETPIAADWTFTFALKKPYIIELDDGKNTGKPYIWW